jgi:subtilisin family serine protease
MANIEKTKNRSPLTSFIIIVLLAFCPLPCFAQSPSEQALQELLHSPKILQPDSVLRGFMEGESTIMVIVNLSDPTAVSPTQDVSPGSTGPAEGSFAGGVRVRNLKDVIVRQQLQDDVKAAQEQVFEALDPKHVRITNIFTYIFGFSAEVTLQGLLGLVRNNDVVSIEEDRILHADLAQGIPLMNAAGARSLYNGSGLAVAICDTGIDTSHPMLGGGGSPIFNSKVIGGYDTGDDDADPRPDPTSGNAHGTACAGIAAGDLGTTGDYIGGVANGAKLYAVKISTGSTGSASGANMIEGWEWCITHQNDDPGNPIMIISTSFSGVRQFSICDSASPAMTQAAANAVAAGMTLFVSSGNDGYCDSINWPACISHVVSVGAVYDAAFGWSYPCVSAGSCASKAPTTGCSTGWYASDNTAADMVTSYSNTASFLNLLGPANRAYTTDIVGAGGYSSGDYSTGFGGTSAACPYAAGAAAVLQNASKMINGYYMSPADVKKKLIDNGDPITDGKVAVTKPRVNLGKAIDTIKPKRVLWNQPLSTANTDVYANQDFVDPGDDNNDIFIADDFANTRPWRITAIFLPGNTYDTGCDLTCADKLNFLIYNDDSGVPDGHPDGGLGGGGNPPVWSVSLAPTDSQVTLSKGTGGWSSNVTLNLNTPVLLLPGTYWLVFYPRMKSPASGCCKYGRHVSDTTNGHVAKVINPGGGSGFPTTWTSVQDGSTWGLTQQDLAFRLHGSAGGAEAAIYLLLLLDSATGP